VTGTLGDGRGFGLFKRVLQGHGERTRRVAGWKSGLFEEGLLPLVYVYVWPYLQAML
jgi:hypothetical protein